MKEERFYLESPSLERKEDAVGYINEFIDCGSSINGVGGLDKYVLDDDKTYEEWLVKLDKDMLSESQKDIVPAKTFFLVRENDKKIVGMINIRYALNGFLRDSGAGHIGYSIRPTERRKGYNKVNLYLGLLELQSAGVKEAMLGCLKENLGSSRTMKALGAKIFREGDWKGKPKEVYLIDVDNSIETYKDEYSSRIGKVVMK